MNKKITIFGGGFIGFASYLGFSKVSGYDVSIYDKYQAKCKAFLEGKDVEFVSLERACLADICFICLPTPMDLETGECYLGYIEETIKEIRKTNKKSAIVIKSTVIPGTTERLCKEYGSIFFNPEFLTEADFYNDFISQDYQLLGRSSPLEVYKDVWLFLKDFLITFGHNGDRVLISNPTTMEAVKYTRNCYLATRLSFFNEIKQICDKLEIDYDAVKYYAGLDGRVGTHYNRVEEKNPGWGLSCLPKDLNAFKHLAQQLEVKPMVLQAVWDKNLEVRKVRDWEEMEKAVIKKEK